MAFEFHFPMPSENGWHQGTRIFCDIPERKNAFLAYKNDKFKQSNNR